QYNQLLILYGYPNPSIAPIVALDTLKFEWSNPIISSNGGSSVTLRRFTSILVGAYILIAFGSSGTSGVNATNNVLLLDISQKDNYKWATLYDPTKSLQSISTAKPTISDSSNNSSINVGAIIGGIFGGIAGLIILSVAAILIVRRYGYQHFTQKEESINEYHP
ncbi:13689_t:CDS:2, partial [Racocetra persica]